MQRMSVLIAWKRRAEYFSLYGECRGKKILNKNHHTHTHSVAQELNNILHVPIKGQPTLIGNLHESFNI